MKKDLQKAQIAIYQGIGDDQKIRVRIEDENVWLTQKLIAELFDVTVPTVNEHLKNIFESDERYGWKDQDHRCDDQKIILQTEE